MLDSSHLVLQLETLKALGHTKVLVYRDMGSNVRLQLSIGDDGIQCFSNGKFSVFDINEIKIGDFCVKYGDSILRLTGFDPYEGDEEVLKPRVMTGLVQY